MVAVSSGGFPLCITDSEKVSYEFRKTYEISVSSSLNLSTLLIWSELDETKTDILM